MSEIVNGRRSITADTASRVARYFAMTPQFWMNLQAAYDLDLPMRASADRIRRDVHPRGCIAYLLRSRTLQVPRMRNVPEGDGPNGRCRDGRDRRGLAVECHELDLEALPSAFT
jgi:hypothetical protein